MGLGQIKKIPVSFNHIFNEVRIHLNNSRLIFLMTRQLFDFQYYFSFEEYWQKIELIKNCFQRQGTKNFFWQKKITNLCEKKETGKKWQFKLNPFCDFLTNCKESKIKMSQMLEHTGLNPSLEFESNDTSIDDVSIIDSSINDTSINVNQTYFAPYEVPVEIVALLSLFYGAISLVAVLGKILRLKKMCFIKSLAKKFENMLA